ncbi:MAG: hypothetical protein BWY43_00392 [candidate division WS2 bacterium ADurb.Bin280]|uniref:Calcineurin-like phosphoesterase n=1 Tax=candidate division WS2 bacterium ADurb.Bin280 TaxID=1852829 RepID=A0A1V5SDS8_9BACT|nr:MAG: hypothetical protein BWY43_00392 [candidate division WS2 bacterium ADurb.Bin280]
MKILFFGDIFGRTGRRAVVDFIARKKKELSIDLVIANADNISSGKGPIEKTYNELIDGGVDVLTCGDHIWDNKEVEVLLDDQKKLIRPINYPKINPGEGYKIIEVDGQKIMIASVLGRVFTTEGLDSPFATLDEAIEKEKCDTIFVDFHAEATSEKNAFGHYFAGRVSAICGTHTHVQTADEKILEGGTAYISDVGMCGPSEGVIGVDKDQSIKRFLSAIPTSFEPAEGRGQINAVIVEIGEDGKAKSIDRINELTD